MKVFLFIKRFIYSEGEKGAYHSTRVEVRKLLRESQFSPSPIQVLGIKLKSSGLADVGGGHLYLLSHLVNTHYY